jgi:probable HAF family extracellular repeat protein
LKNLNRVVLVAAVALLSCGLALAQVVFSVVKVPGVSPNSATGINTSSNVLVNTGSSDSYQVSIWGRISGTQSVGLSGTNSGGSAIDNAGEVVGAGDPGHTGDLQAFVWRPISGVQWLGSLGGALSAATGVSNSGAVVGLSYTAANKQHAFFWTANAGMQDLTPGLTSVGGGTAMAINTSNQVVGYYYPNGTYSTFGFFWTQAGGFQSFGPAGTLPYAINDGGTVVGQSQFANGFRHAFSWTQSGINDLGTLGGVESTALSINSRGWIAGTSMTSSGNGMTHGFLWTPAGGMQDFTVLAGLSPNQQTYSVQVNDFGVVALSTNKGGYLLVPKMVGVFTSSANPSKAGQAVTFTASLNSFSGLPLDGETVQFSANGKVLGTAPLKGGVAQFTTSTLAVGSHPVVANYSGDANYLPTKYTAFTQVVNP